MLEDENYAESVQGFIIAGPAGAGGMLHVDPGWVRPKGNAMIPRSQHTSDSTAYWNALVHGRKRWLFLKPEDACCTGLHCLWRGSAETPLS